MGVTWPTTSPLMNQPLASITTCATIGTRCEPRHRLEAYLTSWTKSRILSNMRAEAKIEPQLVEDPNQDKQVIFQLLSKFNLSAGDVAQIFATYLLKHPAVEEDLDRLRSALRCGVNEEQARILAAAGGLLTSEEVAKLLGYGGRQTSNNKKRNGELLAVSFPNRRGDFFPRCQFDGSHVRAWIPELLRRVPNGWSVLAFLTARYEDLDGQSWLDVLLADSTRVGELLAAADAYVS
jgi:hypothetical protein